MGPKQLYKTGSRWPVTLLAVSVYKGIVRNLVIFIYVRKYGEDDIEIVFDAPTTSWVAVGWRPENSTKSCQSFPKDVPAPKGTDFHAMDCMDMVVGMGRGMLGRVGDYYTRDRSTPRVDAFWGGRDDLKSGAAWEEGGRTVMIFKRKVDGGVADQPLKGKTHFIWATGQSVGFYGEDQFKWHGGNRGQITIGMIYQDTK